MKVLRAVTVVVLSIVVQVSAVLAQKEVSITIEKIVANQQISGSIQGLSSQDYSKYKVIVYVHTDQWYIHPYADQDEGKSWASIQAGGKWQIPTVQREFKADKVAALLVKKNYPEPNKVDNLEKIQHSPPYTFFLLNGDMELHRNRQFFV